MTPKNKICYVATVDITVKFLLAGYLRFLKSQNYDVYVVCSGGKWINEVKSWGVKVKTIEMKRKITPFYDLVSLWNLFWYFKKNKFDIVHTHTPKAGLLGQLAAKLSGVPIIINTVHGFYFQKDDNFVKRKFFIFIEKIAAFCSDIIFFVNKEDMKTAVAEKICSDGKERYFGGGIDLAKFDPAKFSEEFKNNFKKNIGIKPENIVVGIVARLVEEKGYLDLFSAFRKIVKKFPDTNLLVVGASDIHKKDAIKPEIAKKYKIQDKTIFAGERVDVENYISVMDIFVLPSYREGLGISLIEASAMGKPVVTTDTRGCREVVLDKETGILVPVGNSEKLAEAITYFLENPDKAKKTGETGRDKILKEFDEKLVFERIKKEYDRLIKFKLFN